MMMEIIVSVILLFVGIAVLVMIHVCIVGRAFSSRANQGMIFGQRSSISGMKSMSKEELNEMPCFEYKDGAAERGAASPVAVDCVVCLENLKTGERCRLLPNCRHSFHAQCIDSWLLKTPVCPVCRTCAKTTKIGEGLGEGGGVSGDYRIELT